MKNTFGSTCLNFSFIVQKTFLKLSLSYVVNFCPYLRLSTFIIGKYTCRLLKCFQQTFNKPGCNSVKIFLHKVFENTHLVDFVFVFSCLLF